MAIKSSDQITVVDLTDGYSVNLTNDSFTFAGDLILIPLKLTQISCFTLSLKCFSSDSDNFPDVGIGLLLQFLHPPRVGPVLLTLLFPPLVPSSYRVLRGSIYSFREGNGNPLQYSCLENPMDGGAWWAPVHGLAEGWTRLSDFTLIFTFLLQCMKMKSESEAAQSRPTPIDPWTAAYQAPLSMGFSRQEYWSGLPLPSLKE